jgi:hypothetical protein
MFKDWRSYKNRIYFFIIPDRKNEVSILNMAERVGFEPTCPAINETNRFRVDPVTATSVPLRNLLQFNHFKETFLTGLTGYPGLKTSKLIP